MTVHCLCSYKMQVHYQSTNDRPIF